MKLIEELCRKKIFFDRIPRILGDGGTRSQPHGLVRAKERNGFGEVTGVFSLYYLNQTN